jgi:hypothetical protein
MARGTPSYATGTIAAQVSAQATLDLFLPILETQLATYQTNAVDAWQVFDDIDPALATRDRVWQSRGDRTLASGAGDTRLYIRIQRTSAMQLGYGVYQDWATLTSTGSRNPFTDTQNFNATELNYFFCYNEYEFHFVVNQGASWTYTAWVNPARLHIPTQVNGVAFTTAVASAGSSVTVNLDRDISSNIVVGQRVFIMRQTDPGTALEPDGIELPEVTAVTASSITFDALATSFVGGSIVGLDPACFGAESIGNGGPTYANTHDASGNSLANANQSMQGEFFDEIGETAEDPAFTGFFQGSRMQMRDSGSVTLGSWRGESDCVVYWGVNGQTDPNDIMRDVDSGDGYRPFPQLLNSSRLLSFYDPAA